MRALFPMTCSVALTDLAVIRQTTLLNQFTSALTRGGPSGLPRPIELHAHDPIRYVGDMLAWVHQAMATEREFLDSLFGLQHEKRMVGSAWRRETKEDESEEAAWVRELMDRNLEKLCTPLKVCCGICMWNLIAVQHTSINAADTGTTNHQVARGQHYGLQDIKPSELLSIDHAANNRRRSPPDKNSAGVSVSYFSCSRVLRSVALKSNTPYQIASRTLRQRSSLRRLNLRVEVCCAFFTYVCISLRAKFIPRMFSLRQAPDDDLSPPLALRDVSQVLREIMTVYDSSMLELEAGNQASDVAEREEFNRIMDAAVGPALEMCSRMAELKKDGTVWDKEIFLVNSTSYLQVCSVLHARPRMMELRQFVSGHISSIYLCGFKSHTDGSRPRSAYSCSRQGACKLTQYSANVECHSLHSAVRILTSR